MKWSTKLSRPLTEFDCALAVFVPICNSNAGASGTALRIAKFGRNRWPSALR
jgi:hypothetical protein